MENQLKKKVLLVITKSNWGGAQRYVFDLATHLPRSLYDVEVACGGQGELVVRLEEAGIKVHEIKGSERDIKLKNEFIALRSLYRIVKKVKPEILHLNSSKIGGLGGVVGRFCGVPRIVFTAHGWPFFEPRSRLWRTLAWLGSYATALLSHEVICVSQFDLTNRRMPFTGGKMRVIYPALAEYERLPRAVARTTLLGETISETHQSHAWLVTHGELNHNKNHTVVIDAVAEHNANHPNKICYVIIGAGDTATALEEQIALRGMNNYIYLVGFKSNASNYLSAFDLYVIPSKKEGLPYALLEAGLAELTALVSPVGGIPELVTDRVDGLHISPDNHMTIVSALEDLLAHSEARLAYSQNLKQRIIDTFNLKDMIEATTNCYEGKTSD